MCVSKQERLGLGVQQVYKPIERSILNFRPQSTVEHEESQKPKTKLKLNLAMS